MQIADLLTNYTFQTVALGSALLGMISGVLGSFAVLRKQSLLGDGVSHAALPGIVLAFMLTGSKNAEILLLGALLAGFAATLFIVTVVRHSKIKFDSALALIMSVFFGLGMVLLTYVQKFPNAGQAGLNRFIFGQAATLLQRDVVLVCVCGIVLFLLVALFWKEFKVFTFDRDFANTLGFAPAKLNLLLSFLIVVGIIIGLQTVGVVLMSAMLISPAVAARQWSRKLWQMVLLSALFGGIAGVLGTVASSITPKLPTGPAIVVCISIISCLSLLFAPKRGIIHRIYQRRRTRENLKLKGGEQ